MAFPNPGNKHIYFQLQTSAGSEIEINFYNFTGERIAILRQRLDQTRILPWNCENIAPGVYMAVIKLDGRIWEKLKISIVR
ncbi:T9SS type A sorting domain-containing protein [bacterium]|nr:T9SS type A sorting domain-containing protein [bacterium]